jgi:hypothetical protein
MDRRFPLAIVWLGLSTACSVSAGSPPTAIQVRHTHFAVRADTPIAMRGALIAFLADESTTGHGGTDLNGDGDKTDQVAVVVNMATQVETNLHVAATSISWIGEHLYLLVDESLDGRDWNGDSDMSDLVLLHVDANHLTQTPRFVDELSQARGGLPMIAVGTNLYYSSARTPTQPGESNLSAVSASNPLNPVSVPTRDGNGPLSPRLISQDEGLVFLALDETFEGRDLNGDGDASDRAVLALLDGRSGTSSIRSTRLASSATSPVRARRKAAHDWDVGFLVSEADQGGTNLNDPALFMPAWKPSQCFGAEDTDATDFVLHFLSFAAWDGDPVTNAPVNTGLVGTRKIAIANGYIATITPERDAGDPDGAEGSCDLNGDGDKLDEVVRWVAMSKPVLPLTFLTDIHALSDVPGGTHGLAEIDDRFVIQVSESQDNRDINSDGLKTFDYLGWLRPSGHGATDTPWDFTNGPTFLNLIGGSWIAETPDRSRLAVAIEEQSYGPLGGPAGQDLNAHDPPLPTDDQDELDSVPAFASFVGTPPAFLYPFAPIAVSHDNAGLVFSHDFSFYRVSENEDSRDWNHDSLKTGFILFRTSQTLGFSFPVATLNSIPGRPAIELALDEESPIGAAFIADEHYEGVVGTDFNGDGDSIDLVVSYFTF